MNCSAPESIGGRQGRVLPVSVNCHEIICVMISVLLQNESFDIKCFTPLGDSYNWI